MTDAPHITDHADLRVRKRLGLPRKAVEKKVTEALKNGATHFQFAGSFRRYLDKVYLTERAATNMRVHNGYLFLFCANDLITCWQLPAKYRSVKPRVSEFA